MSPSVTTTIGEGDQIDPSTPEKSEILLGTKLFVPAIHPKYVSRPRLIAQLNTGLVGSNMVSIIGTIGFVLGTFIFVRGLIVTRPVDFLRPQE